MRSFRYQLAVILIAAASFTPGIGAQDKGGLAPDVVRLSNGQEYSGKIVEETKNTVVVLIHGGKLSLPRRKIESIVRGERATAEQETIVKRQLTKYDAEAEFFLVYYRGRCVGWRKSSLEPTVRDERPGYAFTERTVYVDEKGKDELDVRTVEFVDFEGIPRYLSCAQTSPEESNMVEGLVTGRYLKLRDHGTNTSRSREAYWADETRFLRPLLRDLVDRMHIAEEGEPHKVFDPVAQQFSSVRIFRTRRREIVGGRHQHVVVWRLQSRRRSWEIWTDSAGRVLREELRGGQMVAMRTPQKQVLAYAKGERDVVTHPDLALEYSNPGHGYRLERPNLTWTFEAPSKEGAHSITLYNATLQGSVDVIALPRVDADEPAETLAMRVIDRLARSGEDSKLEYQKPRIVAGVPGMVFETVATRRGVRLRTTGWVGKQRSRAWVLLMAAPAHRFHEASPQLDQILESFRPLEPEEGTVQN